ncbi:SH3 domain [Trinorchestia longiramus]|nr:SH3 domain [Trinorchestia longiramus]
MQVCGCDASVEVSSELSVMYHWQSEGVGGGKGKKSSVDDMVLLTKINEDAITDNLKKRFMEDKIYTYIGPVLVAVNPFKQLDCFTEREVRLYQGAAQYEVPPHIYALADNMYRNMLIDGDSQCVIISGESGAGKTVSAKFIMQYMTQISGGGTRLQHVKNIILSSNPLLEAFGNAKTTRNNNSSRFGKYIEIQFSPGGEPLGGKVSNFLLEKSRVHFLNSMERNFHIFYQLCSSQDPEHQQQLGLSQPNYFDYLSQSSVTRVDGIDDSADFLETISAMEVMGMDAKARMDVLRVVAAILHMSNISFVEEGNDAAVGDPNFLEYPAYLLGIDSGLLAQKLVSRNMDSMWGGKTERVEVTFNLEKAQFARDAWAKGLYSRLFEYIVAVVNKAMVTDAKDLNIGILDIYGFEIFDRNGFEQFCINYVNEKLQQIFIELTLKNEQEEYAAEGISWTPINYFNNAIVCELIESKRPVGIMCVLDDTCATMSAVSQGADKDFRNKMDSQLRGHAHYSAFKDGFSIKHYAGSVSYHVEGFCEKNRDVLNVDIIEAMQTSSNAFIRSLFPENISEMSRSRPTTVGSKIKTQANALVSTLMLCIPHYIRCIKPNETKKPRDWDYDRVRHQVEYLGLKENIKVKRAGFAYRRPFQKFLARYAILTRETWPNWSGPPQDGINIIMNHVNMESAQYQLGKTKIFVKDPESLYMLEESRERKFDHYARVIQNAFKKHFSKQRQQREKEAGAAMLRGEKERRRHSIHRTFHGDYLGVPLKPNLYGLFPRREKILFALTVDKYDRKFRPQKRDLVVTDSCLWLIGREKAKTGPYKGQYVEALKRKLPLQHIKQLELSRYQDDFILMHVTDDYSSLLHVPLKTELLLVLSRAFAALGLNPLSVSFSNSLSYTIRKSGWGGGGSRKVIFNNSGTSEQHELKANAATGTLTVCISKGLPANSRPSVAPVDPEVRQLAAKFRDTYSPGQRVVPASSYTTNNNNNVNSKQAAPKNDAQPVVGAGGGHNFLQGKLNPIAKGIQQVSKRTSIMKGNRFVPPPPDEPAPANQPSIATKISRPPPKKPLPPKPIALPRVRALYGYDARDADELSFNASDILELIKEDSSGWWTCRLRGKEGFAPGNYVEKI